MRFGEFQPQHYKTEFEAERQMFTIQHVLPFQLLDILADPATHISTSIGWQKLYAPT